MATATGTAGGTGFQRVPATQNQGNPWEWAGPEGDAARAQRAAPTGYGVMGQYGGTNPAPQQAGLNSTTSAIASGQQLGGGAYTTGGVAGLTQGAYEDQQLLSMKGKLAKEADERRLMMLGQAGSGGGAPTVEYGGGGGEEAARAAAYARAKEQAGQTALSALKGLQGQMAGRGLHGSTIEAGAEGDIMRSGAGMVNDYTRQQLGSDLGRYADIADKTYQGRITQRGQDLSARNALLGLTMQGTAY